MDLKVDGRTVLMAAGGLALGYLVWRVVQDRREDENATMAESIGRGVVETVIDTAKGAAGAVVDAVKGAGKAAEQAIWPAEKCAAALRSGSSVAVAWECDVGTFADWLANGRPTDCAALKDGRIECRPKKRSGGASGSW